MRMRGGWPDPVGRGRRSGEDLCACAAGGCVRWSGEPGRPAGLCGYQPPSPRPAPGRLVPLVLPLFFLESALLTCCAHHCILMCAVTQS